jgi:hypothetical protein
MKVLKSIFVTRRRLAIFAATTVHGLAYPGLLAIPPFTTVLNQFVSD